ncbi:MAG: Sec-independent protein translocase protein TatB, partial [Pseudomonadota bacterium]
MFDIAFSELLVIAVVALVVIGPERLPKVARAAGHLLGRLQRYVNNVKADINREMQLEELRKLQAEMQAEVSSVGSKIEDELKQNSIAPEMASLEETLRATANWPEPTATPASATPTPSPVPEAAVSSTPSV